MIDITKQTIFWTEGHLLGSLSLKDNHTLWFFFTGNQGKLCKRQYVWESGVGVWQYLV